MRIEDIRRQNLIWIIEHDFHGIDANLARTLGIQPSQISRLFSQNPRHHRNIGRGLAEKIEKCLEKTDGWMDLVHDFVDYAAQGPRMRSSAVRVKAFNTPPPNVATGPAIRRAVPLIAWHQIDTALDRLEDLDTEAYFLCPIECSKQTFVLRVCGISMEPKFRDGELIFVDPSVSAVHGKFVIVRIAPLQDPVFRQLITEGGKQYLRTFNQNWPDQITEVSEQAQFLGVVIFKGETI
jgi:SOS-response transcriptional repressor LexA